jgi:hypothetical protein
MNPSGLRLEEKKSADEIRSQISYKSTQSSRSSVLQRARAYNRRIDEQKQNEENRRAMSLERRSDDGSDAVDTSLPRSKSAGRSTQQQQVQSASSALTKHQSRAKALESVRRDSRLRSINHDLSTKQTVEVPPMQAHPPIPTASGNRILQENLLGSLGPDKIIAARQQLSQSNSRQSLSSNKSAEKPAHSPQPPGNEIVQQAQGPVQENPIITPELLVEALSGHEDGLLAIAEKLMEHYDSGYDAMGEAIIDAFADVQKLFQHVVEAAHMEGAAFEASRRENEMAERKRDSIGKEEGIESPNDAPMTPSTSQGGPSRHDEFIDQDVQDILQEAIKKGNVLRDANRHTECFQLFESSCQAASSLLPVDSDHRGRLQLSLARAESMSHDRACAILRYAMDDVLRSSIRAAKTPVFDVSKRADVVLSRPVVHPSITASRQPLGVVQSSDEALASLMEEMKEILSAPVYDDTPLQAVAGRFWAALHDAQKMQQKNEERLEHNLGKLKGEYLLARAVSDDVTYSHEEI